MPRLGDRLPVRLCAFCLWAVLPAITQAHEFWIEPSTYLPKLGQPVDVALRVGEHFKGQPVPRKADRIERFAAIRVDDAASKTPHESAIEGKEGDDPAGRFTPRQAGLFIVVYDFNHSRIELEGDKFEAYLKEKGLDAILKLRAARDESGKSAREIYSRCAKSLIVVKHDDANAPAPRLDRAVGLPLEIVAQFDPYTDDSVGGARFLVLFEGKPLSDAQLTARCAHRTDPAQSRRTNEDGEVTFDVSHSGPWLIETTHMRSTPDRDDADYESFWASLTFESPESPH